MSILALITGTLPGHFFHRSAKLIFAALPYPVSNDGGVPASLAFCLVNTRTGAYSDTLGVVCSSTLKSWSRIARESQGKSSPTSKVTVDPDCIISTTEGVALKLPT